MRWSSLPTACRMDPTGAALLATAGPTTKMLALSEQATEGAAAGEGLMERAKAAGGPEAVVQAPGLMCLIRVGRNLQHCRSHDYLSCQYSRA